MSMGLNEFPMKQKQKRTKKSGVRNRSERIKTARGRKLSSTRWLKRQINDPYVLEAKRVGYRSRSAWKLAQLDDRLNFLKNKDCVLDLGAAPGGWTQVALERANNTTKVVAVDISTMKPIPRVEILQLDMKGVDVIPRILLALGGKADVVLSDMASPTTGHKHTDHVRTMALCQIAFDVAHSVLVEGGTLVVKVFQGGTEKVLLEHIKKSFSNVRHVKPSASRKESREIFLVAVGFRN